MVATRLPEKNSQKFEAEQHSTAIVQDDLILAHTDCKIKSSWTMRWTCAPIRVFFSNKRPSFFDKLVRKSNSPCLATSTHWKSRSFSMWVCYLKNFSDRACRVVHSSLCALCIYQAFCCISTTSDWRWVRRLGHKTSSAVVTYRT